jgi:hypothetical protein
METKASKPNLVMETHPYETGRNDMREQIIAYIYTRYVYNKTFFGKDHHATGEIRRIIEDLREDQANEQEKLNQVEPSVE